MSTDRDTTRIVRSWLRTDEHESAARVLDAVLDQLDTTPQRRAAWWPARRFLVMSTPLRWGATAVVAVVLALVGYTYFDGNGGVGDATSTPSASASSSPSPTLTPAPTPVVSGELPPSGEIMQGSYIVADPFPVEIGLEIGPGWQMWGGGVHGDVVAMFEDSPDPPAGHGIIFVIVDNLYADPCRALGGTLDPALGPSVSDLATALASQTSTESSDPVAVLIDGYDGLFLDYRNTGDACGTVTRWPTSGGGDRVALVGERDQVWILDVDGVRLVIDAFSFGGTAQADLDEMRSMIESLDLGPAAGGSQP
jgi:hypothetical protein